MEQTTTDELSNATDLVNALVDAGLLTEQQARAYVDREVIGIGRYAAADEMGIAATTIDDYVRAAKDKIDAAEETLDVLEAGREKPWRD